MDTKSTMLTVEFGRTSKQYEVIERPIPHIAVDSNKELHGWWNGIVPYGNRECTSERLLINPYNGCSHNCLFCYSHALGGYFRLFREKGFVTVFKDFAAKVARQLDGLTVASCGYLSPVTDPFQPLNEKYELSEKILRAFVDRNIPVQFTTKGRISETALKLIKKQEHSFGEVSILTLDEDKRRQLMAGGATTDELVRNIERLANEGKFAVCRIDPIIPFMTDKQEDLEELVQKVVDAGAGHIITSCMDTPLVMKYELYNELEKRFGIPKQQFASLYTETMSGRLHADIEYRRKLFSTMRAICDRNKVTMGLCMEFQSINGKKVRGLNAEFMSSYNCEGVNIPLYVREGDGKRFEPSKSCEGNCLNCHSLDTVPACGIPDLKEAGAWKLKDYRRWSALIKERLAKQSTLEV
ncbi:MAG TPA: radical SAM protein [Candidatus Bathyarchaeia archaeon]|nr:radical SAM protein [Candidatus Bathyarchaeia archaeon]